MADPRATTHVVARPRLLGGAIDVSWSNPPPDAFAAGWPQRRVRVLRGERSYPLRPDEGTVVYDGPVVERVTDEGLPAGRRYYYTVFSGDGGEFVAEDTSRGNALAGGHGDLTERLFRMLPAVHQWQDVPLRADELSALGPDVAAAVRALPAHLRRSGPLRRYLEAVFAPAALLRTTAESLPQLHDVERCPPEFLPLLAGFLDLTPDRSVPLHRQRSELRDEARFARTVGTVAGLRAMVSRYTTWQVQVTEYAQLIARSNAVPQGNVFARRREDGAWVGADDASSALGFGPGNREASATQGPAELLGGATEPFRLHAGMELSVAVDGRLPTTATFEVTHAADLRAATAPEVAAALARSLPELVVDALPDGRLRLRSPGGGGTSSLLVPAPRTSLVTLHGAPRGRLTVADFGPVFGARMIHAARRDADGGWLLRCKSNRDGRWGASFPVDIDPGPSAAGAAEPALVALPPSAPTGRPRALLIWVADPGTPEARLRWTHGTLRPPLPAVLTGGNGSPQLPLPSWLVLRDGRGRRRGVRFTAADFSDRTRPDPVQVVAVLNARLAGFGIAALTPAGTVRIASLGEGGDQRLDVDLAASSAAVALGLDGAAAAATGTWQDDIDWEHPHDLAEVQPGGVADPVAVLEPDGRVRLAYARHADGAWQVRGISWDGTAWSGDELISDTAGEGGSRAAAREPTLLVDVAGNTWVAWSARPAPGRRWALRRRIRPPGAGWDDEAELVPVPTVGDGDREPVLSATSAGVTVFFRSDRTGGRDLWSAAPGGQPERVAAGAADEGWPAVLTVGGDTWLLHRSDQPLSLASLGRGRREDLGTVRRFAGSTTLVPGDLDRLSGRGGWGDQLSYTPNRPDGGTAGHPLRDDERYTGATVGLHLRQPGGPLDDATAKRLRRVLTRTVPATVRVLVHLAPDIARDQVYPLGPPGDVRPRDRLEDHHPDIDRLAGVAERVAVVDFRRTLHSAVPSTPPPADPAAGGVSGDLTHPSTLRWRTHAPRLE